MKMKNVLSLILAMLLMLSLLAGCGSDADDIRGSVSADKTAETTQAAEEDRPVSLGRMEGGVYTNEYAGIGCKLDSDWVFYSAEELQDLPDQIDEVLQGTEFEDTANELQQITDMMAENVDALTTMNVLYTSIGAKERLAYAVMSEEEVADSILAQSDAMIAAYAQAGIEVASMEKVTVNFLGETRTGIHTTAAIEGVDYYILQVFDYSLGKYGVTITMSSFVEDKTDSLLDLWYAVD